jgi:gliding motility-associated-like protein
MVLGQSPIIKGSKFPYQFQWSPDSTLSANDIETPIASPSITNTYRLIASTWLCKPDTTFVTVTVRNLPKPYVSPTLTIGVDGNIQLYAEGGTSYRWTPADNLNKSDIADPMASPKITTLYTVDVIDSFGCTSSDTVRVIVRNEIFIPEVFTPNGDGKNDVFKVYGFGIVDLSLAIFDRYNNKVYESLDVNEITTTGWDGTYKGKALEQGIYRWIIDGRFADGQKILVNGKDNGIVSLIK